MATYYGYKERSAEDKINWSAVGSSMSNMLIEQQQKRDQLKADIDKASVEFGETLSDAPQGEHKGMSEYSINYAANAQDFQLMQLRLLKSGKLNLREYLTGRENLKNGTSQVFDVMSKYQEKYGEYAERAKTGVSGMYEGFLLGEVEGFGNLTSTMPYINPTTGKVSIGKKVPKDPSKPYDPVTNPYTVKMSDNPSDFRTVQELNFALSSQVDSFDSGGAVDRIVDNFAKKFETLKKSGSASTKIDDVRNMPDFKKSLNDMIIAEFESNPLNALSALGDFIKYGPDGQLIQLTRNPAEQNDHTLLLVPNPEQPEGGMAMPDFDSDSGKKLLEHMREKIAESVDAGLNRTIQYQRGFQASQTDKNAYRESLSDSNKANLLAELYSGDKGRVEAALTNLRGQQTPRGTITSISRSNDGVEIIYDYKNPVSFEFGDQNIVDFVSGISSEFGIKDYKKALRSANISKGATKSNIKDTLTRKRGPSEEAKGRDAWQKVTTIMNDRISNNKVNFPELKSLISGFGMTVELQDNGSYTLFSLNDKVGENLIGSKAIWEAAQASVSAENFERKTQTSVSGTAELDE